MSKVNKEKEYFKELKMRSLIIILLSSLLIGQIPLKYIENITPTYEETIIMV